MKHEISAAQVVSARASDTGDAVRLVLADESGEEHVVILPLDQLALLSAWLEQAGRVPAEEAPQPVDGASSSLPAQSVERWTIQPEADDEHILLGFKLAKGAEMSLRMHRSGVAAYAKALTSMLGRLLPAPPSKAKH
ncbi:hypothetical protein H261_11650 [Paramagnetospirillum caucaseum]|uniref:Uncharacterized protein n=1 Tax=Paramagnetospirillum caucaseum TaxID=1244869 RepID=M2Z672_9PROT|nr:hypothetical protein [Paramagnetospirillum caucaseum]EME69820.1 hypothetical protein H261_11650 [Paramagnetospirillum caucaseum]